MYFVFKLCVCKGCAHWGHWHSGLQKYQCYVKKEEEKKKKKNGMYTTHATQHNGN